MFLKSSGCKVLQLPHWRLNIFIYFGLSYYYTLKELVNWNSLDQRALVVTNSIWINGLKLFKHIYLFEVATICLSQIFCCCTMFTCGNVLMFHLYLLYFVLKVFFISCGYSTANFWFGKKPLFCRVCAARFIISSLHNVTVWLQ